MTLSQALNPVNAMATIHLKLGHLALIVDYNIQLNIALKRGDEKVGQKASAKDETDSCSAVL